MRWTRSELPTVVERHAGYLVAVPLVMLLLFVLNLIVRPLPNRNKPTPMKVLVEFEKPVPPPAPSMDETAATRKDSTEDGEEIVDPQKGEPEPQKTELAAATVAKPPVAIEMPEFPELVAPAIIKPKALKDWVPTTQEAYELSKLEHKVTEKSEILQDDKLKIREFIIREEVRSSAKDFIHNTDASGTEGAIRTLDYEGHPPAVVRQVFDRYDIRMDHRYTSAQGGRNFLNAASGNDGTYTSSTAAEGWYDVLTLSKFALSTMASLEVEAMTDRGYDPKTSRVRKIVYGIGLMNDGSYDLFVKELKVEQIR